MYVRIQRCDREFSFTMAESIGMIMYHVSNYYKVTNKQEFFLAVIKYSIEFTEYEPKFY
jgi:hypothetical protein